MLASILVNTFGDTLWISFWGVTPAWISTSPKGPWGMLVIGGMLRPRAWHFLRSEEGSAPFATKTVHLCAPFLPKGHRDQTVEALHAAHTHTHSHAQAQREGGRGKTDRKAREGVERQREGSVRDRAGRQREGKQERGGKDREKGSVLCWPL